jgi:hypothetical protein
MWEDIGPPKTFVGTQEVKKPLIIREHRGAKEIGRDDGYSIP